MTSAQFWNRRVASDLRWPRRHLGTSATSTAPAPQVPGGIALAPLSTAQRPSSAVHCYFNIHRHCSLLCMYCSADIAGKGTHGWVVPRSGAVQTNFSVDDLPGKGVQCACHMQGKQQGLKSVWTNTFCNVHKYILQFGQILFIWWPGKGVQCACHMQGKQQGLKSVWTNTFCNVHKYILQFGQILFIWWPGKGVQCACHMQGKQQSRNQKSSLLHIVRCRQVPCNYKLLHCTASLQHCTALHCYTALRLPLLKYPFLAIFLLAHIQGWGDMLMRGQYKKGCDEQNLSGFDFVFAVFSFVPDNIMTGWKQWHAWRVGKEMANGNVRSVAVGADKKGKRKEVENRSS